MQRRSRATVSPAPHKGFSDLYEKMSGKGESASEAHPSTSLGKAFVLSGKDCMSVMCQWRTFMRLYDSASIIVRMEDTGCQCLDVSIMMPRHANRGASSMKT